MSTSNSNAPTPYSELIGVVEALPLLVRETRRRKGLSLRAAAQEIGVSFATVARAENGEDLVLSCAVALLRWVGSSSVDGDQPH